METNSELLKKLIIDMSRKGYVVSFNVHGDTVEIDAKPKTTGIGSSASIHINANWLDALKALEFRLFM